MKKQAYLVLADGSFYEGFSFGGEADTFGEVVFNTSMIGYQEMLTDPSYAGQILVPTYPLIGNYGVNGQDDETDRIQVRGFVVREECLEPSHYLNKKTIHQYLARWRDLRDLRSGYAGHYPETALGRGDDGDDHFQHDAGRGAGRIKAKTGLRRR